MRRRPFVELPFWVRAGVAGAAASFGLALLLPSTEVGSDGYVYAEMARDPFGTENQAGPYAFRFLVPLLVWAQPLPDDWGFHLAVFVGLVVGGVATALLARDAGVPARLAVLAPPVYSLSFAGVYGVYHFQMLDVPTAAFTSVALLAAWRGRRWVFLAAALAGTASREYAATVPVAWWGARRRRGNEIRALLEALAIGLPVVGLYVVIQLLIPAPDGARFMTRNTTYEYYAEFGLLKFFVRSLVQGTGLLFLLWPLGLLLAARRWTSFHLYILGAVPFMSVTDWNRMLVYLLPFVIPSALLVLSRIPYSVALVALASSAWVAVVLSLHNIPDSAGVRSDAVVLLPATALFVVTGGRAAVIVLRERAWRRLRSAPS